MTDTGPSAVSPLGRYAQGRNRGALVTVRLLGTPLSLMLAAREHHDAVLRELRLMAVTPSPGLPPRLLDLVQVFSSRYGRATARPDAELDAALDRGELVLDLTYVVPAEVAAAAGELEALMREVDAFCASGHLITLPREERVRQFAAWYLAQFREQVAGGAARAWGDPH